MNVPKRTVQRTSVGEPAARDSAKPVVNQRLRLPDAHPLDRHGHHDAGEARPRFPDDQGVHRSPRPGELGGELGQPCRRTRPRGVEPELGAELRIDEQPLDQLAGGVVLPISG